MKLDQIVLGLVVFAGLMYAGFLVSTALLVAPWGLLALIPFGVFIVILGIVIYQKINNREDDYYEKNIDK
ncbi:MAG: hypothetical protein KDJ19_05305 [Hyphomicrobiaceae bacterium]|nr:hypothetical protein [Hyphomicrobiaceae bacterium]MCC0023514.1 hypothetical protein [Hyphomicrobiaceae bacterium]